MLTLGIVGLATGPRGKRQALALREPYAWRWALDEAGIILVAAFALELIYVALVGPKNQGIVSSFRDGSRAPQFALNLGF